MSEICPVNKPEQKPIRQFLRKNQTDAEVILWQYLRGKEIGVKFSRQFGIGNYIADFCCRKKKLVIEVDGGIHEDKEVKENDMERTQNLQEFGYKVIRFKNSEVLNDIESVLAKIKAGLQ